MTNQTPPKNTETTRYDVTQNEFITTKSNAMCGSTDDCNVVGRNEQACELGAFAEKNNLQNAHSLSNVMGECWELANLTKTMSKHCAATGSFKIYKESTNIKQSGRE